MSVTEQEITGPTGSTRPALAAIQHVSLTVTDVAASEAWYGRVLGLHRFFVEPHHGGDGSGYAVVLGAPGLPLNVGLDHHASSAGEGFDAARTGLDHVCFQVPSVAELERWVTHLEREGVAHSGITVLEAAGTRFSILNFRDPDGIALELMAVR